MIRAGRTIVTAKQKTEKFIEGNPKDWIIQLEKEKKSL